MKQTENTTGDLVAFEIKGELFASRITKIDGGVRQMANTVNMTKGCMADLRGKHSPDSGNRGLTREENQRYHNIYLNHGMPLNHYQGEDYTPAGSCVKLNHYICLTTVDIIKNGKVENLSVHAVYDLTSKSIPPKVDIEGSQIERPTNEEYEEYWNAIYEASIKSTEK